MSHAHAYELNRQVTASIHGHGAVFFHTGDGTMFASNGTGAEIWRGLEQHHSAEHIAEDLSLRYRIPLATARAHTTQFIAHLEQRSLIVRRAA